MDNVLYVFSRSHEGYLVHWPVDDLGLTYSFSLQQLPLQRFILIIALYQSNNVQCFWFVIYFHNSSHRTKWLSRKLKYPPTRPPQINSFTYTTLDQSSITYIVLRPFWAAEVDEHLDLPSSIPTYLTSLYESLPNEWHSQNTPVYSESESLTMKCLIAWSSSNNSISISCSCNNIMPWVFHTYNEYW